MRYKFTIMGTPISSYTEYAFAPANALALKPKSLSFDEAATIPVGATTAWQGLFDHGHLQPAQRVLILGGAGGVGLFAVQFAAWKGAHVISTASTSNVDFVRSLGAETVIDYTKTHVENEISDVDLVLDTVVGATFPLSEAANAQELSQSGHGRGRIILHIG
jgi:NADPH:quinone reductase-like Zn-dependent oxidoreductase